MRKRFDSISVLRLLACTGIFICHAAPAAGASGIAARIANAGASGVYLFFVISGFLTAGDTAILTSGGGMRGYFGYVRKRLIRLLPLYYLVMLAQAVLHTFVLRDVPRDPGHLGWLRYVFLTNAVIPAPDNFWGNLGATWTVSLFVVSSLLAPFAVRWIYGASGESALLSACGDGKGERSGSGASHNRSVLRAAALYLVLLLLAGFWEKAPVSGTMMCFLYLHYFALGALIRTAADAPSPAAAARYAAVIAAAAALLSFLFREIGYFTAVSWGYGLLVLLTLPFAFRNRESLFRRAVLFGDRYSYAVYLVHAACVEWIILLKSHVPLPGAAVWGLAVVCTILGTALVTFLEAHILYLYRSAQRGGNCR